MRTSLLPIISLPSGVQVVDSRLISEELGISHKSFMETIRAYQNTIEKEFGQLPFQTEAVNGNNGGGNPIKYALLNEEQAIFLATLSRNSAEVVNFKILLVKSFTEARKKVNEAHELLQKSLTPTQALLATVQKMVDIEREQAETKERLDKVEAQLETRNTDYYSLAGWYRLAGLVWDLNPTQAQQVGKQLTKLSALMNYQVHKTNDARHGTVNIYHAKVLEKYFADVRGK